jgi:hypothetical protein
MLSDAGASIAHEAGMTMIRPAIASNRNRIPGRLKEFTREA